MKLGNNYDVKPFDLQGLVGISDRTLEMHLKLYEGYVKAANQLTTQIGEMLKDSRSHATGCPKPRWRLNSTACPMP